MNELKVAFGSLTKNQKIFIFSILIILSAVFVGLSSYTAYESVQSASVVSCNSILSCDINTDSKENFADGQFIRSCWNKAITGDNDTCATVDLNCDRRVDELDIERFSQSCPQNFILEQEFENECEGEVACDANDDGKIDVSDGGFFAECVEGSDDELCVSLDVDCNGEITTDDYDDFKVSCPRAIQVVQVEEDEEDEQDSVDEYSCTPIIDFTCDLNDDGLMNSQDGEIVTSCRNDANSPSCTEVDINCDEVFSGEEYYRYKLACPGIFISSCDFEPVCDLDGDGFILDQDEKIAKSCYANYKDSSLADDNDCKSIDSDCNLRLTQEDLDYFYRSCGEELEYGCDDVIECDVDQNGGINDEDGDLLLKCISEGIDSEPLCKRLDLNCDRVLDTYEADQYAQLCENIFTNINGGDDGDEGGDDDDQGEDDDDQGDDDNYTCKGEVQCDLNDDDVVDSVDGTILSSCIGFNVVDGNDPCAKLDIDCDGVVTEDDISPYYTQCQQASSKDVEKYSPREAFIISNSSWQEIVELVPVTVWRNEVGVIEKYPTLILHVDEGLDYESGKLDPVPGTFDPESTLHFLRKYKPDKVTIIGDLPQEFLNFLTLDSDIGGKVPVDDVYQISRNDYLSYWDSYSRVVYVQNDYEQALSASVFASHLNAPLVVKDSDLDSEGVLENKRLICVGEVGDVINNCSESFTLEELRREYQARVNSNKILLTNPDDIKVGGPIGHYYSFYNTDNPIVKIYRDASLSSPFLAAAKQELIITSRSNDYHVVDQIIKNSFDDEIGFEVSDQSCDDFSQCTTGMVFEEKDRKVAQGKLSYTVPETIQNDTSLYVAVYGKFYDCQDEYQKVELLNNNKVVATIGSVRCYKEPELIPSEAGGAFTDERVTFDVSSPALIESGTLSIKFDDGKFIPSSDNYYGAEYFINYAWAETYTCLEEDESCGLNEADLTSIKISGWSADGEVSFILDTEENVKSGRLNINLFTNNQVDKYDVSLNGEFYTSVVSNYIGTQELSVDIEEIPEGENLTVSLKPYPAEYVIENELLDLRYYADMRLLTSSPSEIFLTLLGDSESIPMVRESINGSLCGEGTPDSYLTNDQRVYSDYDSDGLVDISTGRIMGVTTSDVSATVARSIFTSDVVSEQLDALIVMAGVDFFSSEAIMKTKFDSFWNSELEGVFDSTYKYIGWENSNNPYEDNQSLHPLYYNSSLVVYDDHGSIDGYSRLIHSSDFKNDKAFLNSPIIFGTACSTCHQYIGGQSPDLFCTQNLRAGALGYQGAVDESYWHEEYDNILQGFYLENKSIGTAYKEAVNEDFNDNIYNYCPMQQGDIHYIWLGDPTIKFSDFEK